MKRPFLILFLLLPLLSWGQKEYSLKGTDFWVSLPNGIEIDSILRLNLSVLPQPDATIQLLSLERQVPILLQRSLTDNSFGSCLLAWQSSPTLPSLAGQEYSPLISCTDTLIC